MHLKDEIIKETNRVEIVQTLFRRLESSRGLQDLLGREKDAIRTQQAARMLELEKKLAEYREKYGVFPGGEKAAREVLLSKKSGANEKISQTVRTILETKATPEEMVPDIMELAMEGKYSCEEASREVVADACEMMLGDSTVVEQLAKENRSLAEKIRDWLREWVENLKIALEGLQADRTESRAMMQYARELQEIWDNALMDAARNNRGTAQETAPAESRQSIRETSDGKKYVKADRQVLFGSDPDSWSEQLEDYINGKIRRGQDVQLIAEDGDVLLLTRTSAGKLSDNHTSDGRTMSDAAFERKANAAAHIDELVEVSSKGKKTIIDKDARHGDMASGGWNYRTAYFMDFDGKYYKTTISVAEGSGGSIVYNVGKMQERSTPQIDGSSGKAGALRGNASANSIRQSNDNSQEKSSDKVQSSMRDSAGRELQKLWDDALMDAARNNLGAARKTAESRQQASPRKKYWRPDLAENEWRLLERRMAEEIGSRKNFLDEATKWVYANEKGVQVFALYGVGDGTDATPLYAAGGEKAAAAAADLQKFVNGGYHYDKGTGTALSWIRSVSRSQGNSRGNIREASRGGETGANDGLHGLTRVGNAGGAAERGSEDQRGVKEKFSVREPVEETRDLLALHNMTMDNLRGAMEKAAPAESRQQARAESGESIEPGEKPLKGKHDNDKMGAVKDSLKEDLKNGKARKEDRGAFLRRSVEDGYQVFEGKSAAYGYRSVRRESARENARQIQEELTELGIDAEIIDGDVLWNLYGISSARSVLQATAVEKKKILINDAASLAPKNTAGHEAYHLWYGLSARKTYEDVVIDNLRFSSKEFLGYQAAIAEAYLGKEADLSDEAQYTKLVEEIVAYISGDIHEGVNDDLLRPMFHDYDAVKAAWVKLCKDNSDGEVRFSVREVGGETMPVLDIQNDTRDYKVAETYLKTLVNTEHPFATILVDAQPVYIGKDLPGEYKGSEYTHGLNSSTRQVKMQAATNLDEMLLLAENGEWRDNVKEKHKQDAKNGWYRYSTRFALPVLDIKKAVDHYTVYSGTLLIRNDADGKSYLYDLLDIKKEKVISSPSFSARERSEVFEPKPSQEQYMQNSRESQAENTGNDQHALRDVAMSDRDVLRRAADLALSDRKMNFTQADRERMKIFKKRLDILDEKQTQRQGYLQTKRDILSNSVRLF